MFLFNWILSEGLGVELKDGRLWKGYQIFWMDEKTTSNNKNAFYPAKKFDTLSWICFLRMPISQLAVTVFSLK
jgi:hypothetical protein